MKQRSYQQWLIELIAIGQVYGVHSHRWQQLITAAYGELITRVFALQDEAIAALRAVGR